MKARVGPWVKSCLWCTVVAGVLMAIPACASSPVQAPPREGLLRLYGEPAQRYTMLLMLRVAAANAEMRIEAGHYAESLRGLYEADYLNEPILNDAWGSPFMYVTGADTYTITSMGSDLAGGPAPPELWGFGDALDVDIVLIDGVFVQYPLFPSDDDH